MAQDPGHDLNYIAIGGALGAIGPAGGDPVVPLNLVGDMGGGGMLLALGITAALGALEPQFYAALLATLGLTDDPLFADQHDRSAWPAMAHRLAGIFASRSRDAWTTAFDGKGACVTPVLSLVEAARHPHNRARAAYLNDTAGPIQAAPAPRFTATPNAEPAAAPVIGTHTREVLAELGLPQPDIDALYADGSVA